MLFLSEMVKFCIVQSYNNKLFDCTQQAETQSINFRNVFKNFETVEILLEYYF